MTKPNKAAAGAAPWLGAVAALGAAALFNRHSANKAERDYPPAGTILDVGGVPVHYVERGTKHRGRAPIVLIHGSGSLVQDFLTSGIVDMLARRHRVLVFDRPGYGYSARPRRATWTQERQARLLVDACALIGAERPIVAGHSWGTLPAIAWALDHRDSIGGLALLSGYYFPTPRPDALMAAIAGSPLVGDVFCQTIAPLQTRLTGPLGNRMVFSPNDPTPAFMAEMPFALALRPGQLRATAADSGQMPVAAARLAPRYPELTLPLAIAWGEGDKLVRQARQSARLAEQLPHAARLALPKTGHMVHHVATTRVADLILTLA